MPLIQLTSASLAYGHVPLLDHVDLVIEPNERIGLIGRNGTGKSSLIKVLEGSTDLDDGTAWRAPGLKLASVPQEPEFAPGHTVFDAVAAGLGQVSRVLTEYHAVTHDMTASPEDAGLLEKLHKLQEALEAAGGWSVQNRVEATLSRLELPEDTPVASLSGGLRKRVALARALVTDPDLLILDEPTNHLDVPAIEWLEQTLIAFPGSVLCVTHDRRFLDRVAQRIVELDRGHLSAYPGNFTAYQARKAAALEAEAVHERKFDKVLAQEEAWIRKGIEARRTRNEGRVRRLEALRRERAARRERLGRVELAVAEGERSGKLVVEMEHASKSYGGRRVVHDFSTRILRGDRVGLIGPNGSGKTTLLKLILGEIAPDSGRVRLGTKVEVAYFDQFRSALDDGATLADTISPGSDTVEIGGTKKHVISYLGDFLFPPERARAKVGSLSGGERNRLLLARLFSRPANVLVLDEPTNDLDIETLELLEELLQDYDGTLLLVSHDRTFLDNVVTQSIASEGDGEWREYAGGYSDWEAARSRAAALSSTPKAEAKPAAAREVTQRAAPAKAKPRLGFKEQRELDGLPAKLETLERELESVNARLGDPALYRDQPGEVKTLRERHAALEAEIAQGYARWEELEAKL